VSRKEKRKDEYSGELLALRTELKIT